MSDKNDSFIFDFSNIYLFEFGDLYYENFETELGIDALRILILNQESSFQIIKAKFDEAVKNDKTLNELEEEHQGSYYMQIFEREELMIEKLKRQQRFSVCLSIFSFCEGRLKSLCEMIAREFTFKIKLDDLNSSEDLMRYWNYLEKVFELTTTKIEPFFTPIKQQKIVRNVIAHQDGNVRPDQVKKINIVTGLQLHPGYEGQILEITDTTYILYLLDKSESFFKELYLAADARYKELKARAST